MRNPILTLAATLCAALAIGTSATAQTVSVSKLQSQSSRTVRVAQCDAMEGNKVSISVELDVPAAAVASKWPKLYNAITAYMAKAAGVTTTALKARPHSMAPSRLAATPKVGPTRRWSEYPNSTRTPHT